MPRRIARPGLALLAILTLVSGSAVVVPAPTEAATAPTPLVEGQFRQTLAREVFGFLPYWEVDSTVDAYLRYDLLTTIAFFSLTYRTDGSVDTSASGYLGYTGATADTIIAHAHAAGVRVVPTIQAFSTASRRTLLSDLTAQTVAIRQTVDLMRLRGADGVNVDIEAMPSSLLGAYGTFIANLRSAVIAFNPLAQISVATGADSWGAQMAKTALANGADRVFLMGYDYHWSGSAYSGAVAPISGLTSTLNTYLGTYAIPSRQLILGLPYYGRAWSTVSDALGAATQTDTATYGRSTAFIPSTLPGSASGWTVLRDDPALSVRMTIWDSTRGTWRQTYYDDPTTLTPKVALANTRDLAGFGMWALGYDRGQPGFWEMIAEAFGAPRITRMSLSDAGDVAADTNPWLATPPIPPAGTTRSRNVVLSIGWTDGTYPATDIRLSNDGITWSAWLPIAGAVPWSVTDGPDGYRRVRAQLRGGGDGGPLSKVAGTGVVLDRTDPPVSGPTALPLLRSTLAVSDGTALVTATLAWAATDGTTRITGQALEGSTDGTTWTFAGSPAPTARRGTATIAVGGPVRYRLAAADLVGWVGGPVSGPAHRFRLVDDRASGIVRSSGWSRSSSNSAWAGTSTWTTSAGRSIAYRFTGRAISVLAPVGPTRGAVRVYLDGTYVGAFSEYASSNGARRIVYVRAVAPGTHTITLVTVGTSGHPRVDLDAFLVLS